MPDEINNTNGSSGVPSSSPPPPPPPPGGSDNDKPEKTNNKQVATRAEISEISQYLDKIEKNGLKDIAEGLGKLINKIESERNANNIIILGNKNKVEIYNIFGNSDDIANLEEQIKKIADESSKNAQDESEIKKICDAVHKLCMKYSPEISLALQIGKSLGL